MKAVRLRTEFLNDPIGIDVRHPRIMWNVKGSGMQKAFQVKAIMNGKECYESGKIVSDERMFRLPVEMKSRDIVEWSVLLFDD